MKKIEDKYKVLDQITHILLRPQTYVGSNKIHKSIKNLIGDDKIIQKEISYIPSFIKIFDEVVTNSVDENKRNQNLNKIDVIVDVDNNIISVKDNGGIPVVIHKEHNQYVPEVIFGNLMSGNACLSGGYIDGTPIGANVQSTGRFTTLELISSDLSIFL